MDKKISDVLFAWLDENGFNPRVIFARWDEQPGLVVIHTIKNFWFMIDDAKMLARDSVRYGREYGAGQRELLLMLQMRQGEAASNKLNLADPSSFEKLYKEMTDE